MSLHLLTLNIWGLGYGYSKDRLERITAFAQVLPSLPADIITLQEVWLEEDQTRLIDAGQRAHLPYAYFFRSGILGGSGLLTLSRFPILEVAFHEFRLKTRPERVDQGDYYFGKGIGLTRLDSPFGVLDVYNLHTMAQYQFDENDMYMAHRSSSHYEAAQFILKHSPQNPVIVMGDFNMLPHHIGYRLMRDLVGLTDCYSTLFPDAEGITYSLENIYNLKHRESERLDYIWTRGTAQFSLAPLSAEITLQEIPELPPIYYSDHYAVAVEVAIAPPNETPTQSQTKLGILRELSSYLLTAQISAEERRRSHLWVMWASLLVGFLLSFGRVESRHRRTRIFDYGVVFASSVYALYSWLQWMILIRREVRMLQAVNEEVRLEIQVLENPSA